MIRNTVVNSITYFYPLGNTPAVSLSQDLPSESDARILLLGCGDARNILFTCFADPDRKFDFTCCDIEPAVIARNVVLFTLLIDDVDHANEDKIWDIYFHWRFSEDSKALLSNQAAKLLSLSATPVDWHASNYGKTLKFCDRSTLTRLRGFWQGYISKEYATSKTAKPSHLQDSLDRAQKLRNERVGQGITLGGLRSASPVGVYSLSDFGKISARWWSHGTTSFETDDGNTFLNPAFLSSSEKSLVLHYGTDPLLGFPLATAYIPTSANVTKKFGRHESNSERHLVRCARWHFRAWAEALNMSIKKGTIVRFCVADAIAFSLTLQNAKLDEQGRYTSYLRRDSWSAEPLILDNKAGEAGCEPHLFRYDVIDTSNLIDHLGPLNLLPVCATLLKPEMWSTIYSETLIQNESSEKERVAYLLGGEIRTVALLLGLSPCEIWTNATNTAEDDSMSNLIQNPREIGQNRDTRQVRSRLRWKQLRQPIENSSKSTIQVEPAEAANALLNLYNHMLDHENINSLFQDMKLDSLSKRSLPMYNRASFALVMKAMQRTVVTEWDQCFEQLLESIFDTFSTSPNGANYAQELLLYVHVTNINTKKLPSIDLEEIKTAKLFPLFRTWSDIPFQTCITLRVPRKALDVFTSDFSTQNGTPALKCDLEDRKAVPRPWSNSFSAVQVAFGRAKMAQERDDSTIQIIEDQTTWWGQSDMFVSMFVPTWILLQDGVTAPVFKCGLLPTPQSVKSFLNKLGVQLTVFESSLLSDDIMVSKCMPSMLAPPILTFNDPATQSDPNSSFSALFSPDGRSITSLAHKVRYTVEAEKAQLQDRSNAVQIDFEDFQRASIQVGEQLCTLITFPVPVDQSKRKLRIARRSSYVELEVQLWNPLMEQSEPFLFPTIPPTKTKLDRYTPIPWTATRVNLDAMPILDLANKTRLQWLNTHSSMMFSTKERQIREAGMTGQLPPGQSPGVRIEIKEGIFTMFMSYTGLQGHKANVFGLYKEAAGGVNVILIPSCIRLDLVNRSVVFDMAAIPLTTNMLSGSKVRAFLQSLVGQRFLQVKVSDEELRSWKSILPALTERCRTWKHKAGCEYAKGEQIPVAKGLEDGFTPFCSCGIGQFPAGYLKDVSINNLDHVIRNHATRIALSPIFAVPYVEDCFLAGTAFGDIKAIPSAVGCSKCGNQKRKGSQAERAILLVCGRCKNVKYCSTDCQKADWKNHKQACSVVGAS